MQDRTTRTTTQTATSALYDASNELDRIRGEVGTIAILVGHFDSDISEGLCSFLTGWANGLDNLAGALDDVRKERAAQMAESAAAHPIDEREAELEAKGFQEFLDQMEPDEYEKFAARRRVRTANQGGTN